MDICKRFGRNINKFRREKGLSQEELAERSNLHRTYVSAVERGVRSISLKNIEKLAVALDISVSDLFRFEEECKNE